MSEFYSKQPEEIEIGWEEDAHIGHYSSLFLTNPLEKGANPTDIYLMWELINPRFVKHFMEVECH